MNASEARNIATRKPVVGLAPIREAIRTAAQSGSLCKVIYQPFTQEIVRQLGSEGYRLEPRGPGVLVWW